MIKFKSAVCRSNKARSTAAAPFWKQKMSPGRIKIRVIKTVKRRYVSSKIDCRLCDKCPNEKKLFVSAPDAHAPLIHADESVRWCCWVIELYLKHRKRLINILDMIDGKEQRISRASQIGYRSERVNASVCQRERENKPLTPGRHHGILWRDEPKKKKIHLDIRGW